MGWMGYPLEVTTPRGSFALRDDQDHGRMVASCRHAPGLAFQPLNASAGVQGCAGCLTVALTPPLARKNGVWES